jgi:hypothetical protein
VILDDDELDEVNTRDKTEGVSGDIKTRYIEQDPNPYNIFATPELPPGSIKFINISSLWFDIEIGYYIKTPVSKFRFYK